MEHIHGPILFYYNNDPNKPVRKVFIDRIYDEYLEEKGYCLTWLGSLGGTGTPQINVTFSLQYSVSVPVARLLCHYVKNTLRSSEKLKKMCKTQNCVNPKHYEVIK